MQSNEIRSRFLSFFEERGHSIIPSASLVPENDPTVLFTTAGMQPLVPYFLGQGHPEGKRLASSQKCVRTVDIDDIGDNRHLTFFEMLGNWSLGDYFKTESIAWSWEFLTSKEKGLGLDPDRLYVTVFAGDEDAPRDEESIALWKEQLERSGVSAGVDLPLADGGRIFTMSKETNWWGPAGQTGPCGPDTEIYYDIADDSLAKELPDGLPDFESGRLLEIWNNVFMEYRKTENETFEKLEQHNVDTGMGLERIVAVIQGAPNVYETDMFTGVLDYLVSQESPLPLKRHQGDEEEDLRIIADHLRAAVHLINDGIRPSNKAQGYILRRLLRRAALRSQHEGQEWIAPVVAIYADFYADSYPQIKTKQGEIVAVITEELQKFQKSLAQGKKEIAKLEHLTAKAAFDLYQNFGFPWELSKEYAASHGLSIEQADFEAEFEKHKELSRTASAGQFASGLADHSEMTVKYHTATHLLHQALRTVLGDTVEQKGSNITPERLRFDFSYPEKLTVDQLQAVEDLVNQQIVRALPVTSETMSPEAARDAGALGFFAHKYGDTVSVYTVGDFSKEICTGPHVENTATMGKFSIVKEGAVSAGVRRIKAVLE